MSTEEAVLTAMVWSPGHRPCTQLHTAVHPGGPRPDLCPGWGQPQVAGSWLLGLSVPAPSSRGPGPGGLSPPQLPCCLGVTPQSPQPLPGHPDPAPATPLPLPSPSVAGTQQVLNVCLQRSDDREEMLL